MKKRYSEIELLKIICIFFIIAHHYAIHGGYEEFLVSEISGGIIWIQLLSLFGKIACSVFAMITGFFMIDTVRQRHYRKVVPIIFQMFVYSWVILAICCINEEVSLFTFIQELIPIVWGNWYIVNYIILYMFVPMLNQMLKNLERKNYTTLLVFILIIWCLIPTFTGQVWNFSNLDFFLVMYLIGGYIRRYCYGRIKCNNRYNKLHAISCIVLLLISVIMLDLLAIILENDSILQHATYFKAFNSILAVPCAIFIFSYFMNLKFNNDIINDIINYIAKSSLGIYLIHDNELLRVIIWEKIFPNQEYINNPYIHSVIKIMLVFIVCLGIDVIYRETLGKFFEKWFNKNCDSWIEKIRGNRLVTKLGERLYGQ